ncbi:hypothetical protein NHX12_007032 [Muraenolepis orangiensis]|uniref:Uncharacterized protein n=1 Tax=Muraenolepis orangiensis TaxID=630683 RepID=A0A9Q0DSM5_9TELE|nr:hypothetical protein NHX12_007032 [Muraenolepis orangiensis]
MAVSITEPLCHPCVYHDNFKVNLQLRRPLSPTHLSPEQVGLEMLCLCGQLDLLVRAQVQQFHEQLSQDCSPEESDTFQIQGAEILDQMLQCLEHLPKPMPQLEDYLDMVGLSTMFPRVEVYLIQGSAVGLLEKPPMEVICSFRGTRCLAEVKKDIEANFKQMKLSLVTEDDSRQEPQLAANYVNWILTVTESIASVVSALPEDLAEDLSPALSFISQLLTQQATVAP